MNWTEGKPEWKSKTVRSGVITIVWGILVLFGYAEGPAPQTIDQLGQKQKAPIKTLIGLAGLGAGAMAIKGRYDADTPLRRRKGKEKNEE